MFLTFDFLLSQEKKNLLTYYILKNPIFLKDEQILNLQFQNDIIYESIDIILI